MFNRQKTLLFMIDRLGGLVDRLKLTKLCFLLSREAPNRGGDSFYQFVPYQYGPFSFTLYHEVGSLVRDGLLSEPDRHHWTLTPAARKTLTGLPNHLGIDVLWAVEQYGRFSSRALPDLVYRKYPWFTINSQDVSKRLEEQPVADFAVYTIGYEKLLVDSFLNRLLKAGIRTLIDVRANPVSRQYGYHRSTLTKLCKSLAIEYRHYPELGVPSNYRANLETLEDYEDLFHRYREEMLPQRTSTLEEVSTLVKRKPSALMCMEADPAFCHRSGLAKNIAQQSSLPTVNLGWPR